CELFATTALEIFLVFATFTLQVGIEVGQLTLTLDAVGLRQHRSVFVEFLCLATQAVCQVSEFVVATLELGFELGLRCFGRLGVAQDALCADKTNFDGLLRLGLNDRNANHRHRSQRCRYDQGAVAFFKTAANSAAYSGKLQCEIRLHEKSTLRRSRK